MYRVGLLSGGTFLHVVLAKLGAPAIGAEPKEVGVVERPLRLVARGPVSAPANRDGAVTIDRIRLVASLPRVGLVGVVQPAADDGVPTAAGGLRVVDRALAVDGVLAEEIADQLGLVRSPGRKVSVQPGLDVCVGHGAIVPALSGGRPPAGAPPPRAPRVRRERGAGAPTAGPPRRRSARCPPPGRRGERCCASAGSGC